MGDRESGAAVSTALVPTRDAPLPHTYEAARQALEECSRVDECKDWADKAAALASYARQADDDELYQMARRIQGRAVRRAGELLKAFNKGVGRPKGGNGVAAGPISQRDAANEAGMSKRQEKQAVRIANLPEDDFEAAVESDHPPTVTVLAGMGGKPAPKGFTKATHLIGAVGRFAQFCEENEPAEVAGGVMPSEVDELKGLVAAVEGWLDRFVVKLGESV